MKRKPIRINWDDLEAAFDDPNQEQVYFLDVVDGHILLEGEGEEDEYDDEDDGFTAAPAPPAPLATRIAIEQVTTELKLEWMERFIAETTDLENEFVAAVNAAIDSDDPAPAVIEALRDSPEAKDRWYRYRTDRVRDRIDEWLRQHEIEITDPPPWKQP